MVDITKSLSLVKLNFSQQDASGVSKLKFLPLAEVPPRQVLLSAKKLKSQHYIAKVIFS